MDDPKITRTARSAGSAKAARQKPSAAPPAPPAAPAKGKPSASAAADVRMKAANPPPLHDDGGDFSWAGADLPADQAKDKAARANKMARLAERSDVDGLDIAHASQALMARMGGAQGALGLVIAARGGEGSVVLEPEIQLAAMLAVRNELGLAAPPSNHQLRDMDHWLNSYYATHDDNLATPERDDGFLARTAKTIAREGRAVGGAAVVVGYSGVKAVSQWTGVDVMALVSDRYSGNGERTSTVDFNELYYGISGLFHGAYDTGADR